MNASGVWTRGMWWLGLFAVVMAHAAGAVRADGVSRTEEWSLKVGPDTRLKIGAINGNIRIKSVPGDVLRVQAVFHAPSAKDLARMAVEVKEKKHRISLKRKDARAGWFGRNTAAGRVDFIVQAPPFVALDGIRTINGQVTVSGNHNRVRVDAVNGQVDIRQAGGSVAVDATNGDVAVSLDQLAEGQRITVDTINGNVRLNWPGDASARIHADTVNGSVRGEGFTAHIRRGLIRKQFDATIGDGGATVNVSTVNGHVTLKSTL